MYFLDSDGKAARTSKEMRPDSCGSVTANCSALDSMSRMLAIICYPGRHLCVLERWLVASCVSGCARHSVSLLSVLLREIGRFFQGF